MILVRRKRAALIVYGLGTSALLAWSYVANIGFTRHHGFLFLVFIASLWIAYGSPGNKEAVDAVKKEAGPPWRRKGKAALLAVFLLGQFIAGAFALGMDFLHPFSQAKNVARHIRELGYAGLPAVGDMDIVTAPVAGHRGGRFTFRAGKGSGHMLFGI